MNDYPRSIAIVLIRFAGLYLAYSAIRQIVSVILLAWYFVDLLQYDLDGTSLHEKMRLRHALPGTMEFLITAGTSYYLLRKGNWVIDFLCKESDKKQNRVEPDGSGQ